MSKHSKLSDNLNFVHWEVFNFSRGQLFSTNYDHGLRLQNVDRDTTSTQAEKESRTYKEEEGKLCKTPYKHSRKALDLAAPNTIGQRIKEKVKTAIPKRKTAEDT